MSPTISETNGKRTVNESVYLAIKADIIECRLLPNDRLRFEDLRQRYGAAFSSLREALSRLVADGLVVMEQHRGARVADMRDGDFQDLLYVRRMIEAEAIRNAIRHGDDAWEANLVAAFHLYERTLSQARERSSGERISRHNEFHNALVSGCNSKRVLALRQMLYAQAERYLMLSFKTPPPPAETVIQEHETIMLAALDRKSDLAAALIEEHLEGAAKRVLPIADTIDRLARTSGRTSNRRESDKDA